MNTIKVPQEVPLERVSDLLTTALDPGYGTSYYWCDVKKRTTPPAWTYEDKTRPSGIHEGIHWRHEYPLSPGGSLTIVDKEGGEGKEYILDLEAVERGLKAMAEHSPRFFGELMSDSDDGDTGDAFLQYCLFGKIIYG